MPATPPSSNRRYQIPANLLQPLWLRSRESLVDNGLVYDPIAANACRHCQLAPECLSGDVDQKQLLHATLTQLCDQQVKAFIERHPEAWILNVGAGLDTRFYRVDNGRCHWLELDVTENLLWRQKLFHNSERYQHHCGSVDDLQWLESLPIPQQASVMVVCEHALLDCSEKQVAKFVQSLGRHFDTASACIVLAGDKASSSIGQKMGSGTYSHGFSAPGEAILQYLPWAKWTKTFSPLDKNCGRWKFWQRWLTKFSAYKQRLTPVLVQLRW
ncbi:class I SAM-dependent methyltransferase [Vibrio sp. SCSIO 43135]|uniref:class I SAM-dependent methyltransferase n=1 Tax=Vibrio sp. SCSIO 43135 TaxID=2819096 RepID=UPI002075DF1D|nr:class I SAM-dependent methyltransferase [Vibrio sp. SCSIO 43135]USD40991.1 class I SAM-dependent methyltransferase [Vibrio sp. SCSIO 43135]